LCRGVVCGDGKYPIVDGGWPRGDRMLTRQHRLGVVLLSRVQKNEQSGSFRDEDRNWGNRGIWRYRNQLAQAGLGRRGGKEGKMIGMGVV